MADKEVFIMKDKWAVVRLGSSFLVCEEEEEENNWPKITRHSQWERGSGKMPTCPEDAFVIRPSLWLPALPCQHGRVRTAAGKQCQEGDTEHC